MLTDARGSQSRFLPRMANKEMFGFVCRKMKIQEDTFYTTRQRERDQFHPATVNGQKKKKENAIIYYPFSVYVIIRLECNYSL